MLFCRVEGKDVLSHMCSATSVSEDHIREVTRQLLSALEYLQRLQIVHCDIKVRFTLHCKLCVSLQFYCNFNLWCAFSP